MRKTIALYAFVVGIRVEGFAQQHYPPHLGFGVLCADLVEGISKEQIWYP